MTDAVEFSTGDVGAPRLDGQEPEQGDEQAYTDPYAEQAAAMAAPIGWTAGEAAQVIGGLVATITTALYAMRWQAVPAPDLVPVIAGHPEQEFALLGMSLAPVLDRLAPKGSAAAVGVGLGAGVSEVLGAMVRRMPVLAVPPPDRREKAPQQQAPAQPPPNEGEGFRYRPEELRVLARADGGLSGLGLE